MIIIGLGFIVDSCLRRVGYFLLLRCGCQLLLLDGDCGVFLGYLLDLLRSRFIWRLRI